MAEKIQAIRGMNDILPDESHQWEFLEHTVRNWLSDYGYGPYLKRFREEAKG